MNETNDQFAIVELFGHARIAGRTSEQTIGGQSFVRVDVPAVSYPLHDNTTVTIPAHTRSFGAGAIYSINWCDQAAAEVSAQAIKHRPIEPYNLASTLQEMSAQQRARVTRQLDLGDDTPF